MALWHFGGQSLTQSKALFRCCTLYTSDSQIVRGHLMTKALVPWRKPLLLMEIQLRTDALKSTSLFIYTRCHWRTNAYASRAPWRIDASLTKSLHRNFARPWVLTPLLRSKKLGERARPEMVQYSYSAIIGIQSWTRKNYCSTELITRASSKTNEAEEMQCKGLPGNKCSF